jgi:hypothetical protein
LVSSGEVNRVDMSRAEVSRAQVEKAEVSRAYPQCPQGRELHV